MLRALVAVGVALAVGSATAGCGPDARLTYADETARLASAAITDVESSGGEDPALLPLLGRAHVRLGEVESAIDEWRDHSGPLAYRAHAPCLRAALIALREALTAEGRPVPAELDQAESMLSSVSTRRCTP